MSNGFGRKFEMKIQWLGHACFRITEGDWSVVIDPYDFHYTEGYPELRTSADEILVSHEHAGHNCRSAVQLSGRDGSLSPFTVETLEVDHDSVCGIMRGHCRIHILRANGVKIAHMSDIGTQLNGGEITKLLNCDAMMITAGSLTGLPSQEVRRVFEETMPTVLIPMHYRDDDRGTRRLEQIKDLESQFETPAFFQHYDTDTIEITGEEEPQVAVLKFQKESIRSQFPKFKSTLSFSKFKV